MELALTHVPARGDQHGGYAPGDLQSSSFAAGCLWGRESERQRLASELHDCTSQLLIALKLQIAGFNARTDTPGVADLVEDLEDTARQIEEQVRAFAFVNFPAQMPDGGLVPALQRLADGFSRKTGIETRFELDTSHFAGRGPAAQALLRVAQEALANVYRHACATAVCMSLTVECGEAVLRIADDGRGLPDEPCGIGIGIEGMRQRLAAEGGRLALSRMRPGALVTAAVPASRLALQTRSIAS